MISWYYCCESMHWEDWYQHHQDVELNHQQSRVCFLTDNAIITAPLQDPVNCYVTSLRPGLSDWWRKKGLKVSSMADLPSWILEELEKSWSIEAIEADRWWVESLREKIGQKEKKIKQITCSDTITRPRIIKKWKLENRGEEKIFTFCHYQAQVVKQNE